MYFTNPTGGAVDYMLDGTLGFIDTPLQGNKRPAGVKHWCADNGCFNDKRFTESKWWEWLTRNAGNSATCAFATAPDVVGDHAATIERSRPWLPKIRNLGYPVAFVAQDGATPENLPWNDFDVLFIGGTDKFKLGTDGRACILAAKQRGMWVHVGRVNSRRRYRAFAALGVDSADGTHIVFEPSVALPKILSWIEENKTQTAIPITEGMGE